MPHLLVLVPFGRAGGSYFLPSFVLIVRGAIFGRKASGSSSILWSTGLLGVRVFDTQA